jgi:DNA-binding NarL/FixJ family response regulator
MLAKDQFQAEREVAAHVAVAEALVEWDGIELWARRMLSGLGEALDCEAGVFWVPGGDALKPRVFWHDGSDLREFRMMTLTSRLKGGSELPGQAWELAEPRALVDDAGSDWPRWGAAAAAGMSGAVAFPAICADEVLAIVELASREEAALTERWKRSLTAIGYVLGEFLVHRRGVLDEEVITPRQAEVLQLAAEGLSAPQIAERLVVAPTTVRSHFENIYERMGVRDRVSAVAEAVRLGLVS